MYTEKHFNKTYNRLYQISEKSAYFLNVFEQLLGRIDIKISTSLNLKQRYYNHKKFYTELLGELKMLNTTYGCSTSLCRPPAKQWIDLQQLFSAQSILEIENLLNKAIRRQLQHYDQLLLSTDEPFYLVKLLTHHRNQIYNELQEFSNN